MRNDCQNAHYYSNRYLKEAGPDPVWRDAATHMLDVKCPDGGGGKENLNELLQEAAELPKI